MTAADQFWASTEPAAPVLPESSTVTNVYRFTPAAFAARLGIPLPDSAKIAKIETTRDQHDDHGQYGYASVKITIENRLESKP